MKLLLIVAALLVAASTFSASWGTASWGTGIASASSLPVIYVSNSSTVVPQADVEAALPAFQTAVSRDLAKYWHIDAVLTTDPAQAASADMTLAVSDDADQPGALGYHDVGLDGRPYGKVFARTGAAYNESWQLTFTHELFEMLVDPWINRFSIWNHRTWLVEVGDPCESGFYAYAINGVVISDFITPSWYGAGFGSGKSKAPLDFTKKLKRAGQIGKHGYASYQKADGTWGQVFG